MSDATTYEQTKAPLDLELPEEGGLAPASAPPLRRAEIIDKREASQPGRAQDVLRVIVRHTDEIDQLVAAIAAAQAKEGYGDIEKTRRARVESRRTGGVYEYSYETLSDVLAATRPFLAAEGVAVMQFPFPGKDSVTIRTMLAKGNQFLYNDLFAYVPMPDPQAVGSGISYLRRYALKSITGVAADDEDDDGAAASQPPSEPVRPAPRKSEQVPPAAKPEPRGVVARVQERDGTFFIGLENGYIGATRSAEIGAAAKARQVDRQPVELVVARPAQATGPSGRPVAPTVTEIALLSDRS